MPDRSVLRVGIDVVGVERFTASIVRTPAILERLFSPSELLTPTGCRRRPSSLAARFAAKEAVAKALGAPRGMDWHHCRVVTDEAGRPALAMDRTVALVADRLGIASFELSLSHDAGIAAAIVVALGAADDRRAG